MATVDTKLSVEERIVKLEPRVQALKEINLLSRRTEKQEPKFFDKLKKEYQNNIDRMRSVEAQLREKDTAADHAKSLLMILFSKQELATTSRLKLDFWRLQFIEVALMRKLSINEDARDDLWKQCKVEISRIVTAVYRHQTEIDTADHNLTDTEEDSCDDEDSDGEEDDEDGTEVKTGIKRENNSSSGGADVDATEVKQEGGEQTNGSVGVDANAVKLEILVTKLEEICVTLERKGYNKLSKEERKEYNENKERKREMEAIIKKERKPELLAKKLAKKFEPILNGNPKTLDFWKLQYIKEAMLEKFKRLDEGVWETCKSKIKSSLAIEDDTVTEERPED